MLSEERPHGPEAGIGVGEGGKTMSIWGECPMRLSERAVLYVTGIIVPIRQRAGNIESFLTGNRFNEGEHGYDTKGSGVSVLGSVVICAASYAVIAALRAATPSVMSPRITGLKLVSACNAVSAA